MEQMHKKLQQKSSITPFSVTEYSTVPCVPLGKPSISETYELLADIFGVGLDPVYGDVGLDPVYGDVGLDPVYGDVGLDPVYGYVGLEPADGYVGLDPVDG
ncbi:hypothetical protein T4B_10260 [Trichinella pseudospiralis]|uniref:Uncharacterized protein n=2 Tax=Trichinella pseudospiralis TaxID=6337 RepID=A0A0V1K953_TRIPS|nr:hypothetical protein T4A_4675 [Trichinella pseudospiralis]KRY88367.1 hypothetical protein T4D_14152 [Trichinella pseudospiralis]KRZ32711.1 hypothetical protein T4B_10260 [Trichinella pseudospiralis]KRZ43735.1 hypothetical protein T4C_12138 [Trichinella pseudospiralis]